jgi:hypothetical protein
MLIESLWMLVFEARFSAPGSRLVGILLRISASLDRGVSGSGLQRIRVIALESFIDMCSSDAELSFDCKFLMQLSDLKAGICTLGT